jgi:CelD/BcsL family acetyltransferase involved in cellulose biosynthesis
MIRWVEDEAELESLAEPWDRLADRWGTPFLRHDWFAAWWEAFAAGRKLRICTVWEGDELAAVYPLCASGGRLETMRNAHTPGYSPFARDDRALRAVIEAAFAECRGYLVQRRIPAATPVAGMITDASRRAGMITFVEPGIVSPIVLIDGDFETFMAGLSKKTRGDARRCRRLLEAEGKAVFRPIADPADLEAELTAGFAVEGSGWKTEQGTAILSAPETERFYRSVCRRFARRGRVGLSTLELEGRLIAFSLNLVDFGKVWGLKGGYEREFARFSPGILLTVAEIERCYELGLETLEMLGDEAAWKRKFGRGERRHVVVHSYRRRPGPVARYLVARFVRPYARRAALRLQPQRARG